MVDETGLSVDGVFNSKENVKTVSYFQSLLKNKYMSKVPIDHLFESGRAAFKIDGAWEVNTLYTSYPDVSFGVAPYVVGDSWNGERYAPTGSWAGSVYGKSQNHFHPHMKLMNQSTYFKKTKIIKHFTIN